jgi:hypothetical protein
MRLTKPAFTRMGQALQLLQVLGRHGDRDDVSKKTKPKDYESEEPT